MASTEIFSIIHHKGDRHLKFSLFRIDDDPENVKWEFEIEDSDEYGLRIFEMNETEIGILSSVLMIEELVRGRK